MTEIATAPAREASDVRLRKPTKFLADLTRAMRAAADEARQGALAQFQTDVERHTESARGACGDAATDARRRADEDITALGEWEKTEIARIRAETEQGITARQGRLEEELADHAIRFEAELARVRDRVAAFEREMDTFFEQLHREEDPAQFAAMAEQLPEPPTFEPWTAMTASGEAASLDARKAEADLAAAAVEAELSRLPMGDDDFAAAEAEAAAWNGNEPEADGSVAADAALESGADALGPESAADAEQATDATTGASGQDESARPTQQATPAHPATTRTQVAVIGLVSVASIATFKRMLARLDGAHGVSVSSGPDGEFLFTVTHDEALDLPVAVTTLQGFDVQVVESGPGVVNVRTVDPEVV